MKAIIVEDEIYGQKNLIKKLEENCPQVEVVAVCDNKITAIQQIQLLKPELVFLDVSLDGTKKDKGGFQVLSKLKNQKFEVIFTSAVEEFAVKAFKEEAVDFLTKPIDEEELVQAVTKAEQRISMYKRHEPIKKLPVPIQHGYQFIDVEGIMYCEADNTKTIIHLYRKENLNVSRTLKKVEEMLAANDFIRIHRKYLINRDYLKILSREEGGYVKLDNGPDDDIKLPVSRDFNI